MARMLANENVPADVVTALKADGHDVSWMRDVGPGTLDDRVLALALSEGRIVLTFDKDFGELAFNAELPASCGIVLFRLRANSSAALAALVVAALRTRFDWAGQFAVVEPGRIRMRPLPTPPGP
jgi:predicted nuclease of predicted toxin-antitoxin system